LATLDQIEANRGCPLSRTSVTVGINRAFAAGSSATRQLGRSSGPAGCQSLVNTQVVTEVNLALGRGTQADQAISAQGPGGVLAHYPLHPWREHQRRRRILGDAAPAELDRPLSRDRTSSDSPAFAVGGGRGR